MRTQRSTSPEHASSSGWNAITASTEFQLVLGWLFAIARALDLILLGLGIDGRTTVYKMTTALGGLRLRIGGLMGKSGKAKEGQNAELDDGTTSDEDDGLIGSRRGRATGVRLSTGMNNLRTRRRAEVGNSSVAGGETRRRGTVASLRLTLSSVQAPTTPAW